MREIKFKIQIDGEKWEVLSLKEIIELSLEGNDISNCKTRQYTGLEDINDVPVYEGDIIKDRNDNELGVIDFEEGSFMAKFKTEGNLYLECLLSHLYFEIEVIGNIYENPELIKN